MRRIKFQNNYLYHIYNRGTEKRDIFLNKIDYFQFIHYLYEFNNINSLLNLSRDIKIDGGSTSLSRKRELLVDIIAFCLMPNHFHLVLRQLKDNGISKFMQKLGTGYTMYFNTKNNRTGALFQGRFKAVSVDRDNYFLYLINYIHLNPIELIEPEWKEKKILNGEKAKDFLENYRWSSYLDCIGIKNFPSVINKTIIMEYFKTAESYSEFACQWFNQDKNPINQIKNIILD